MSNDPSFLHQSSLQDLLDIPSPALNQSITPTSNENFQYATCPQCRSHRARLTKHINRHGIIFSISCPFCGYQDDDVCDY